MAAHIPHGRVLKYITCHHVDEVHSFPRQCQSCFELTLFSPLTRGPPWRPVVRLLGENVAWITMPPASHFLFFILVISTSTTVNGKAEDFYDINDEDGHMAGQQFACGICKATVATAVPFRRCE